MKYTITEKMMILKSRINALEKRLKNCPPSYLKENPKSTINILNNLYDSLWDLEQDILPTDIIEKRKIKNFLDEH